VTLPAAAPAMIAARDPEPAVVGGKPNGHGREQRKRVDCQREQQPAQIGEADESENDADDDHGGGSPCKVDGCASHHHHHGAMPTIADPDRTWNPHWDKAMCIPSVPLELTRSWSWAQIRSV
jgi:hypothetical protein